MSDASDERFTIAFYGLDTSAMAVEGLYSSAVKLFVELGYPPDRLGYSTGSRKNGVGDFRRINARLANDGFGEVKSFDVHRGRPNAVISGLDYFVGATFSRDDGPGFAVISIPSSQTENPSWPATVRDCARILKPVYGIGFHRQLSLGPDLYALGIGYGTEPGLDGAAYEEELNRSRWADMAMPRQLYRDGVLRDIYPWNFLTAPQLNARVSELSLQEWIGADPSRGTLARFVGDVWLWELDARNIASVRAVLANLIFNWRNYV